MATDVRTSSFAMGRLRRETTMLSCSYALVGLTLGLLPAALIILTDRSVGHGGDTFALLALIVLGIPGMIVGCVVGDIWQHGTESAKYIAIPVGSIVGALGGLGAGLVLHELARTALPLREQDVSLASLFVGGMVGVLLAGARRDL